MAEKAENIALDTQAAQVIGYTIAAYITENLPAVRACLSSLDEAKIQVGKVDLERMMGALAWPGLGLMEHRGMNGSAVKVEQVAYIAGNVLGNPLLFKPAQPMASVVEIVTHETRRAAIMLEKGEPVEEAYLRSRTAARSVKALGEETHDLAQASLMLENALLNHSGQQVLTPPVKLDLNPDVQAAQDIGDTLADYVQENWHAIRACVVTPGESKIVAGRKDIEQLLGALSWPGLSMMQLRKGMYGAHDKAASIADVARGRLGMHDPLVPYEPIAGIAGVVAHIARVSAIILEDGRPREKATTHLAAARALAAKGGGSPEILDAIKRLAKVLDKPRTADGPSKTKAPAP